MEWPPQDTGLFAPPECIMCCVALPELPACFFNLPRPSTPGYPYFSTFEDAEESLTRATCLAIVDGGGVVTFESDASVADEISADVVATVSHSIESSSSFEIIVRVAIGGGDVVLTGTATPGTGTFQELGFTILNSVGGGVASDSVTVNPGTITLTGLDPGIYYLIATVVFLGGAIGESDWGLAATFSCANGLVALPVVALWNDGTPQQLDACPMLELPWSRFVLGTEAVYDDRAAAVTDLTAATFTDSSDGYAVVDCKAIIFPLYFNNQTLSASVTADTYNFSTSRNPAEINRAGGQMFFAAQLYADTTVSVSGSVTLTNATSMFWDVILYRRTGETVATLDSGSASDTINGSIAITETGVYYFSIRASAVRATSSPDVTAEMTVTVSSDGEWLQGGLAAYFDRELECPGWLPCEDAAP